jgi:hypothetical protein
MNTKATSAGSTHIKMYTVRQLQALEVPEFQRWIVSSNKNELSVSVSEVGILRCPIICHVQNESKDYIIDGNHLIRVLIEKFPKTEKIACIYKEVETYADAAKVFKMMNTKGKKLDLIDYTNLYMHTNSDNSPNVYKEVWTILGNPSSSKNVNKYPLFSIPTIVEVLAGDKNKYKNGETKVEYKYLENYLERCSLLNYLLHHAYLYFEKNLKVKGYKMPSGAAMIGFIRTWLGKEGFYKSHTKEEFLKFIEEIYIENSRAIELGKTVINRDNSGKLLSNHINTKVKVFA